MDATLPSISATELARQVATGRFPCVIDVRREERYADAEDVIRGARRRRPDRLELWAQDLHRDTDVVVYCVHGHDVSQNAATALLRRGFCVSYLEGGMEAWRASGGFVQKKPPAAPGRWITRERPKIDRIACPWLIRRFIDPDAVFLYVPGEEVFTRAKELDAEPYDIPGAAYSHEGPRCSLDAFIARHRLQDDPALARLALIVRAADTGRQQLDGRASGLLAVSLGLSAMFQNDDRMLTEGMLIYDALYAWCASARSETHNWPPAT